MAINKRGTAIVEFLKFGYVLCLKSLNKMDEIFVKIL